MASHHSRWLIMVAFMGVFLLSRSALGEIATSLHPSTLASNTTSRLLFTVRTNSLESLGTGDQIVFVVRSHAPNGAITISNVGTAVVTSDPATLGLQGTWTSSTSGTDTIILTYAAGATNHFNPNDVVAVAANVTPSAAPPNGGEYPGFVSGILNVGGSGVQSGSTATLAFVGFPVAPPGPVGPPGPQGPPGTQGSQGPAGVSVSGVLETPGANCAAGGVAYTSASGTNFVCNGTMGAQGTMGNQGSQGPAGEQGPPGPSGHGGCSATGDQTLVVAMLVGLLAARARRCAKPLLS